ncbi:MAG: M28 family peptidase [Bacteroidota bacterium]
MNHALQDLYDQLKAHPKRFKRPEKEAFLNMATDLLRNWGYQTSRLETKGKIWTSVNIETKCKNPEFIIMAHYDTPTMLPPWFEIFVRIFGHTRPILMTLALLVFLFIVVIIPGKIAAIIAIVIGLSFLLFLLPNPRNLNDNTSGVLGLLYLAKRLEAFPKAQRKVKFVLVDNEEMLLTGAEHLRDQWEADSIPFEEARIIALDCIAWGSTPIIVRNGASYVGNELLRVFQEERPEAQLLNMGLLPMNDNYVFRDAGAILVAFMDKAMIKNSYYIKNIHSVFDRKLDLNKVKWITDNIFEYMGREGVVKT